jgi:hypothetical protein
MTIPAEPSPELRIPGQLSSKRVVSMSGIRLGSGESARAFKGIICDDMRRRHSFVARFGTSSVSPTVRANSEAHGSQPRAAMGGLPM